MVCVSWNDAQAYIQWLSRISGKTYRLLSEAEREYAARGGTQTAFWWGDSITTSQANYNGNYSYNGSPKGQNNRQTTVPVNSFSANPFGLYNVNGNVWEWVQDCWHENYAGAPTDGSAWTTDCHSNVRVLRGGSWYDFPAILRSALRSGDYPVSRDSDFGFRLAKDVQRQKAQEADRLRDEQAQSEKLRKDALERALKQAGAAVSNDELKNNVSDALLPLTEK